MIVKIPKQRQVKNNRVNPFKDLVDYTVEDIGKLIQRDGNFSELINYETATHNHAYDPKCVAVRIHGIARIESAAQEMAAVASQNTRCTDPAYHFILSWPEFEKPSNDAIFNAAEHGIRSLGMGEHQYVIAIHADTDNVHCHVAVNRIHPDTFKSHHIEWSKKTLHMAARQSEIQHSWHHDNGYYVVQVDPNGKKTIVMNTKFSGKDLPPGIDPMLIEEDEDLPSWHDPESLDTWLKGFVTKNLKKDIGSIQSWYGLHSWLEQYGISLVNTGGGGMRLTVISQDSGEIREFAASRGLRILKLAELEGRWGKFRKPDDFTEFFPDLSKLNTNLIQKGVQNVINKSPDRGHPPPDHIINAINAVSEERNTAAARAGEVHDMSHGNMENRREATQMLVQNDVFRLMGRDGQGGADQDVRRAGSGKDGGRKSRGLEYREERREYRKALRQDLRSRYAQYRRFTHEMDAAYWPKLRNLKLERKQKIQQFKEEYRQAQKTANVSKPYDLNEAIVLKGIFENRKLQAETVFQKQLADLNRLRIPPLGWRVWLHEQSQLGDQAAISALRGIVYQAKRDAKLVQDVELEAEEIEISSDDDEQTKEARRFKILLKRLYEEEQREISIHAARYYMMRPHEVDAILVQYNKISWGVTGNGNIEFIHEGGDIAFIDKGNRVTFDRELVNDHDLELAMLHASRKFGNQILITGSDEVFIKRMVETAIKMNIRIINPELKHLVKAQIHNNKEQQVFKEVVQTTPTVIEASLKEITQNTQHSNDVVSMHDPVEVFKRQVKSIIPNAEFISPVLTEGKTYTGKVYKISSDGNLLVQHQGNNQFVIHSHALSSGVSENDVISIKYNNGIPIVTISNGIAR